MREFLGVALQFVARKDLTPLGHADVKAEHRVALVAEPLLEGEDVTEHTKHDTGLDALVGEVTQGMEGSM
jgi:hypothetical protein